jgi:putative colanic acid biosynthesis acetyltransferase WcaF
MEVKKSYKEPAFIGPACGSAAVNSNTIKAVYRNRLGIANRAARVAWALVQGTLFRWSPRVAFFWRRWLLRAFGARMGEATRVCPTCKVWAPWNLVMEAHSSLADDVDCYSVDRIHVGVHVTVSQGACLCTASHDYESPEFALVTLPIRLEGYSWVGMRAFVSLGVTVGEGAVVGATASVYRDVPAWSVVGGNPARVIKRRVMQGVR